jgi:hypothetical protein
LLVTDDQPWPAGDAPLTPLDLESYKQWSEKKTPRRFGTLVRIDKANPDVAQPDVAVVQDAMLIHPSGIAVDQCRGLLYVAESDASETRWLRFKRYKDPDRWERDGVLAVAPNPTGTPALFQGVAVLHGRVCAAGPGGVYVFQEDGKSVGKLSFDEPVTGLAVNTAGGVPWLYMAVGHRLCRIGLQF